MKIKSLIASLCLFGMTLTSAHAEIAVIVSPKSGIKQLDQNIIARIFMAKASSFPSGEDAIALDMKKGSDVYNEFSESFLNKSPNQLSSYWSRLIFTGRAKPNKEVDSASEMKKLVAKNPNMIGYIDSDEVDVSVVVVNKR